MQKTYIWVQKTHDKLMGDGRTNELQELTEFKNTSRIMNVFIKNLMVEVLASQ